MTMINVKIFIIGIVQGVGFRPFIARLAEKYELFGSVYNNSSGVIVEVQAEKNKIRKFVLRIRNDKPPLARIDLIHAELIGKSSVSKWNSFIIKKSDIEPKNDSQIIPDANTCDECMRELFSQNNRRFLYPFINCTNCGPRYSIISNMPYDRERTSMRDFKLCKLCEQEYEDKGSRRYHAEPISCPNCGPKIEVFDKQKRIIPTNNPLLFISKKLAEGKIVALKNTGGFHLVCNACDDISVKQLRDNKQRPTKPFAVMFPTIELVCQSFYVNQLERQELLSKERPIVILKSKKNNMVSKYVNPELLEVGVMLPSDPIQAILFKNADICALVMTSGNITNLPIEYTNQGALENLTSLSDFVVVHNREIINPVDDGVERIVKIGNKFQRILIRRARGLAPLSIDNNSVNVPIMAVGSELKNTISFVKFGKIFISQYIGDVSEKNVQLRSINIGDKLRKLLTFSPQYIVHDIHPNFNTTIWSENQNLKTIKIQHHEAHFASVLGEHQIVGEALGVILDGTGYGNDGTIFGGEIFIGNLNHMSRIAHIGNIRLIGGDIAIKNVRRIAVSLLLDYAPELLHEWVELVGKMNIKLVNNLKIMHKTNISVFNSSSMGRLFDGVSAILGVCAQSNYEGEAAILLEKELPSNVLSKKHYDMVLKNEVISIDHVVNGVVNDKLRGESNSNISWYFHTSIVWGLTTVLKKLALEYHTDKVCLSGGVFLNKFILENVYLELSKLGLSVFINNNVPCNDENISLGQAFLADTLIKNNQSKNLLKAQSD